MQMTLPAGCFKILKADTITNTVKGCRRYNDGELI